MVIGKFYSPAQLAFYNRAFSISQLSSTNLMEVIGRTIYPIYCELQDKREELKTAYRKYIRLSTFAIFPIMAFVCALSYPLISVLHTDKWLPVAPLLSLFCVGFSNYIFQYNASSILTATGYAGKLVKINTVLKIVDFTLLIMALFISVEAVVVVFVFNNFLFTMLLLIIVKKNLKIKVFEQLNYVKDIIFDTVIAGLLAWELTFFLKNVYVQLFLGGFAGLVLLLALFYLQKIDELSYIQPVVNRIKEKLWKEKH
jgi:O-antigen/teichoic acid export membrane protein